MEEILKEIQLVKWLLISLISIFGLIFLGIIYIVYNTKNAIKNETLFGNFSSEARDLLDKGLPNEVVRKAKSRLETHPKDKWAHWYLAEAYRQKEEYTESLKILMALQKIAPKWNREYIEPSINEIKVTLKSIKPEVL